MDTIKYVGTATNRIIREKEWEQAGVVGQETVLWEVGNGYTVDASKLTQAARDLLKKEPFFVFSNRDDSQGQVEQEETIDLDVAKEYEDVAKANTTSADGTGLDEPVEKISPKRRK